LSVTLLPSNYSLGRGSGKDRALLVKFMQKTYAELSGSDRIAHLAETIEQYFSPETPLWWVFHHANREDPSTQNRASLPTQTLHSQGNIPIACLWLGTAVDQLQGDRYTHVFLLYVAPDHRRQGIGAALMQVAEDWARQRGDRQIGLQVFQINQTALNLYQNLGYQVQSLGMSKRL
jgi:GNAT superfamily N-acetyltransferase